MSGSNSVSHVWRFPIVLSWIIRLIALTIALYGFFGKFYYNSDFVENLNTVRLFTK